MVLDGELLVVMVVTSLWRMIKHVIKAKSSEWSILGLGSGVGTFLVCRMSSMSHWSLRTAS